MSELEVSCNFLEFPLRFPPPVSHLSYSNGSRSRSPKICPHHPLPIHHVPQFHVPWVAKWNCASAAGNCQALPRPAPVRCPHRRQCSEKPKAEALGSVLFSWLCPPSLLITPSVDIVVGVAESQPWPEVLTINKMPLMKLFQPGSFNEKWFALFYLSQMPCWDWRELCSSGAGVSSRSQRLSEVAFLKLVCLWLTNLCLAFRWEREIEEGWVNRQTGASFIPGSANCFSYIRDAGGGL